jgi:hypothetical protein
MTARDLEFSTVGGHRPPLQSGPKLMFKIILSVCLAVCMATVTGTAYLSAQIDSTIANSRTGAWTALPLLGFLLDGARALRPVIGIPGAASVADAVNLGFDISQAEIPPGHAYILATTSQSEWPLWIQVRAGTMTIRPMDSFVSRPRSRFGECFEPDTPGRRSHAARRCAPEPLAVDTTSRIDRIALSPTGSAAALFSESSGRIHVFTNMPESPALVSTFDGSTLGRVTAMGVSDNGQTAAVGVADGASGALFVLNAGQTPRLIARMGQPSAIRFLRNSERAIVADSADNTVYALAEGQVFPVATAQDGIAMPVGLAVSNDNQRIFVANSESRSVVTVDLNGRGSISTACNCAVTGLHATNTDSVFRLTDFTGGPILLFDGNSAAARIHFVPLSSELTR